MTSAADMTPHWLDTVQSQIEHIQEHMLPLAVRRYPHLTRRFTPYLASLTQIKTRLAKGENPTRDDLRTIRWAIRDCGDVDTEMFIAEQRRESPVFDAFWKAEQRRAAQGEES